MESELSLCETNLQFHLVTKDGLPDIHLKDLTLCFERIAERFQLADQCVWVSESECLRLATTMLTNRSVFVFAQFETPAFEKLRQTDAMILGPQCIISCLVNEFGVPNTNSPVFNVLLRERLICSSGLNAAEKSKIQKLVEFMGGSFQVTELTQSTSHLVTNTVMSLKYEQAAINNIRIVTTDWVHHLWAQSCQGDLDANTLAQLDDRFRVPIFNKLGISSTGITGSKKAQLVKSIESNGGKFFGAFKSEVIDVLIATAEHTASDKFRAAIKCRKMCLTPEWISESVAKGYALPIDAYRLEVPAELARNKLLVSTPTKRLGLASNESAFNADCTNLSEIVGNVTINESVLVGNAKLKDSSYKTVLANINVQLAKKAGSFLDGCNIYLAGFTGEEKEKIGKILGSSNATHFQELNSRVEYVIVGQPSSAELQQLCVYYQNCNLVTLEWLVASIAQKQPANERPYLFKLSAKASPDQEPPTVASPASKKNIQSMNKSMNNSFRKSLAPRRLDMAEQSDENDDQANAESDLLQQYLVAPPEPPSVPVPIVPDAVPTSNQSGGSTNHTESQGDGADSQVENPELLKGLTFHLHGFIEDSEEQLEANIAMVGGRVVPESYPGTVDYLLVPTDIMQLTITMRAKHTVNEHWIEDVVNNQEIVEIEYFHQPFYWIEDCTPLTGLTIVLTTYSGSERMYLMHVAQIMGATVVDRYVKNMAPILICPKPEGAKYNGAIKWKLPVVNCEWLLLCAKAKRKMPMRPFLVGASVAPQGEPAVEEDPDTGPITSTANPLLGLYRPANMPNDVSPIRSVEKPESSVDRLKRQRPDEFATPQTPVLKHRRLSELGAGYASGCNSPMLTQSPQISVDEMMKELVADLPTPQRDYILSCRRVKENETPETRRRIEAVSTPDLLRSPLPKEWQTPARQQRMAAIDNMHILPPLPTPPPTTPYAEISRRFWKRALGDQYVSPTQQLSQNTMISEPEQPPSGAGSMHAMAMASAAAHAQIKRLSDFIENNKGIAEKTPLKQVEVAESMAMNTQAAAGEINSEGNEVVGWLDPTDFNEKHRFRKRGAMQHVGTPRFNISCCDPVLLDRMMSQIVELKGTICENRSGYDPTCTHVVCEKPSRSEKIFSAIAAGKWLLSPKYIKESAEAGHFLNEEAYEWGNPKAAENVPCVEPIGLAAHRWRKQIQAAKAASSDGGDDKIGAFCNFRVILHSRKKDAFRSLLEAGGGCMLDVSEPFESSKEALTATHCIVDAKCKLSPLDHKALKRANVLCVSIAYLQEYITADTPPKPEDFAI